MRSCTTVTAVPANLSPEYKAAEAALRRSRDPQERLEWLREMLRAIPKHKGTEHLQADIKARIKELAEAIEGGRKGGGHGGGPALVIRPEGAAQIALIGPPNAGKSSLHARLTGSGAHVGPYPFTTRYPQAGMMAHEDTHFQLIDLPPIAPEHAAPCAAAGTADRSRFQTKADCRLPTRSSPGRKTQCLGICRERVRPCPLYPRKQTFAAHKPMSAKCQKRTSSAC